MCEKLLSDIERALVDVELKDQRSGVEFTQVGSEVAETQRRVLVFGVERCKEDVGHCGWRCFRVP
jgi:hypothetical protein